MVNSALRYRGQAPLVDSLLSEIGLKGGDINGLQDLNKGAQSLPPQGLQEDSEKEG